MEKHTALGVLFYLGREPGISYDRLKKNDGFILG